MNKQKQLTKDMNSAIDSVTQQRSSYCNNPDKDFIRGRKLRFETVIRIILSMTDYSLREELHHYWKYQENAPTKSAFIQQRQKIFPEAIRAVFDEFT